MPKNLLIHHATGISRALAIAGLLAVAAGIRLAHLDQPLLGFHPTRQYRSAIIARACYVDRADVPSWARHVAHANRAMQPAGEPPLLEWLACSIYDAVGAESLAVPRILSVTAWLSGAFPLYALARRLTSAGAAIVALATFLFLPYGIVASRAFQPDALMTAASLWALLATARAFERPTHVRFLVAASAIAAAALIKPMSVFVTVPGVAGFALSHDARGLRQPRSWWLLALGLTPPLLYYGHAALFGNLARDQLRFRFVPSLLPTAFFWGGLWTQVVRVMGPMLFVAAVAGAAVATRTARPVLVSLWVGYFVFAVAFTYHMATHDYYHLPYVALAAWGVASLVAWVERYLSARGHHSRAALAAYGLAATIAIAGTLAAWPLLAAGDRERIARYEEIGEVAEHHPRVLFLDSEYGYPLMYHGQVAGDAWPGSDDLAAETLAGAARLTASARFARDFADYDPAFFIVTDLRSLREQPDLQQWLAANAHAVRQTPAYHVYRLEPR